MPQCAIVFEKFHNKSQQPIEFEYFDIFSVNFHPQASWSELRTWAFVMQQHLFFHPKWSNQRSDAKPRGPRHFCLVCIWRHRPAKFKMLQSVTADDIYNIAHRCILYCLQASVRFKIQLAKWIHHCSWHEVVIWRWCNRESIWRFFWGWATTHFSNLSATSDSVAFNSTPSWTQEESILLC